jgi:spermidine synthase
LARDPQRVLVVGCGAGITAGAISVSPAVRQETIVEIEPLVPRAASRYFSKQNDNVIANPKVHVQIDDARHFLLTTHDKFDAISTDPFDTWVKGAATLNTQEFYEEMKRRLTPGGVVTVWIQFYETNEPALKSQLATFMKVFPNAVVFGNTVGGQGYDGVMVGSADPLKIDVDAIAAKLQRREYAPVRQSLRDVFYNSAPDLLSTLVADGPQLSSWLADAQINRDRNLRLQYLAGFGNNNNDEAKLYRELVHYGGWPQNLFTGNAAALASLRETQAKQLLAAGPAASD